MAPIMFDLSFLLLNGFSSFNFLSFFKKIKFDACKCVYNNCGQINIQIVWNILFIILSFV